jgi:hypothetical protein
MRASLRHLFENPIRLFALFCVAVTSAFFGYLAWWLITIISSPDWCGRAMQAERITPGSTFVGLTACIVLVVIVIAGARLAGKVFGTEVDVSRQDPAVAAGQVADAAVDKAAEIREQGA